MAELLLTAGTDDEIFTILGLIVTPLMVYLVYIGFFAMNAMNAMNAKRNGVIKKDEFSIRANAFLRWVW